MAACFSTLKKNSEENFSYRFGQNTGKLTNSIKTGVFETYHKYSRTQCESSCFVLEHVWCI